MNSERNFSTFGSLYIGQKFIDPRWDEPCIKVSEIGARDKYCAPGFEVSFQQSEPVVIP